MAAIADGEGYVWRANAVRPYQATETSYQPVGANCVRPQNDPTDFSLTLEATSLAKQRRLFKKSKVMDITKAFSL